jgi:hypothetical protein
LEVIQNQVQHLNLKQKPWTKSLDFSGFSFWVIHCKLLRHLELGGEGEVKRSLPHFLGTLKVSSILVCGIEHWGCCNSKLSQNLWKFDVNWICVYEKMCANVAHFSPPKKTLKFFCGNIVA